MVVLAFFGVELQINRFVLIRRKVFRQTTYIFSSGSYFSTLFPVTTWLPNYSRDMVLGDLVSGLTVGLMAIPQGSHLLCLLVIGTDILTMIVLAYAEIASLPVQFGLYSSYIGIIVYTLMGTSKDISLGPTAVMSLLVGETLSEEANLEDVSPNSLAPAYYAENRSGTNSFASVWSAPDNYGIPKVYEITNELSNDDRLGILAELISRPVISGFVSSVSIIISVNQVHHFFGTGGSNKGFIQSVQSTFTDFAPSLRYFMFLIPSNMDSTHWPNLVLGLSCLTIVFALKFLGTKYKEDKVPSRSIYSHKTGDMGIICSAQCNHCKFSCTPNLYPLQNQRRVTSGFGKLRSERK